MDRGLPRIRGRIKWFDSGKGFGFVLAEDGGPDILLHVNALRNFGQNSVCDDADVIISVHQTPRGLQVAEIFEITAPERDTDDEGDDANVSALDPAVLALPLEPARVKWFDKAKGFGFANVFGQCADVFIHMEVLRRSGFSELQPGEAVGLRISEGERGLMAVAIASWEEATRGAAFGEDR